ncbi:hypothetical protein niasHT_003690 [Heterodera trifolii]|uniref:Uncharacterized protein n=1 Tax=Heterodera trifolii TaxID=157864 RepID=A0ABD2M8Z3_9BILA
MIGEFEEKQRNFCQQLKKGQNIWEAVESSAGNAIVTAAKNLKVNPQTYEEGLRKLETMQILRDLLWLPLFPIFVEQKGLFGCEGDAVTMKKSVSTLRSRWFPWDWALRCHTFCPLINISKLRMAFPVL